MPKGKPKVVEEPVVEPDSIMVQLAKLGGELQAVAADKAAREGKLHEIESVLGKLQIKDFPELADSDIIANFAQMFANVSGLNPGEVKNKGTLAEALRDWTWADVNRTFKPVKFYSSKEITLTFNGLSLRIPANREVEVPECFYSIYREHMYAQEQAAIDEAWIMGQSNQPPDHNWQTAEHAEVRAHSMQGQGRNLSSGFLGVGPIRELQESDNS